MQSRSRAQIHDTGRTKLADELAALARAEEFCDQALAIRARAEAEAAEIAAWARADADRLLRHALAVIADNVASSESARRDAEMDRAAAQAERMEAAQILGTAKALQRRIEAKALFLSRPTEAAVSR